MTITNKKRSKSKVFWKYGSETRAQRIARLHTIKANAKARQFKKKPDTEEQKAKRVERNKTVFLRVVREWLAKPEVAKMLEGKHYCGYELEGFLNELLPEDE